MAMEKQNLMRDSHGNLNHHMLATGGVGSNGELLVSEVALDQRILGEPALATKQQLQLARVLTMEQIVSLKYRMKTDSIFLIGT
jgi:hypothetical protein